MAAAEEEDDGAGIGATTAGAAPAMLEASDDVRVDAESPSFAPLLLLPALLLLLATAVGSGGGGNAAAAAAAGLAFLEPPAGLLVLSSRMLSIVTSWLYLQNRSR